MTYKLKPSDGLSVVRIVAIYALFSSLWIYLSDSVLGMLVGDVATITRLSKVKGIVFIVLTALLLYRLIIRHARVTREAEERIIELNKVLEKRNAELERLVTRKKLLFDASVRITSQTNMNDLLTMVAETARELAGARYSAAGHGYVNGKFITGGASRSEGAAACPPGQVFSVERGGVYMELIEKSESIRLTDAEMRAHPMWWGLPDDHVPLRGLLGSRLINFQGRPNGLILVSDKENGSEFTAEDEAALRQLAIIASVALQHIESEESLHQAKEAAEAANRAKSQFLANMSHELRTPMAGVLGMLEITLGGALEAGQREFIETAHHSAGSLVRILNDILEMTKIEAGMFSTEGIPFSLRECVAGMVDIFIAEARRKGLNLVLSVADDVPESVVGDQLRLRQVLTNLVANAVKFTEQGKVELKVEALNTIPSGNREITFTVTDTGIGIPEDKKHLIFRPFSQVDESHSRTYGGTGLGLVISKEIVERMGGMITFDCEKGGGCRFTVTVPFDELGSAPDTENTNPMENNNADTGH